MTQNHDKVKLCFPQRICRYPPKSEFSLLAEVLATCICTMKRMFGLALITTLTLHPRVYLAISQAGATYSAQTLDLFAEAPGGTQGFKEGNKRRPH